MEKTVEVRESSISGRGLFAARSIKEGEWIAEAPLLILSVEDTARIKETRLGAYVFYVDEESEERWRAAVAFGAISMCNHASNAAATFRLDIAARLVRLFAARAISAGEEITIDYEREPGTSLIDEGGE